MSPKRHANTTAALLRAGASWATNDYKHVSPNDPCGSKPSYHIHPDARYPHQDEVRRFTSIKAIRRWLLEMSPETEPTEMIER